MKYQFKSKLNTGFTFVELLLALTTAIIILVLTTSFAVSVMRSSARSSNREILQQTKNDLSIDFSNNVRWAKQINVTNGGTAMEIDGVKYIYEDDRLTKTGENLTSNTVKVTSFSIEKYTTSLGIKVGLQSKQDPNIQDSLYLILSPRGKEVIK